MTTSLLLGFWVKSTPNVIICSLQRKSQMDVLLEFIKKRLDHSAPGEKLKELRVLIDDTFQLMPSNKHMAEKNLGRLESTASLKSRAFG